MFAITSFITMRFLLSDITFIWCLIVVKLFTLPFWPFVVFFSYATPLLCIKRWKCLSCEKLPIRGGNFCTIAGSEWMGRTIGVHPGKRNACIVASFALTYFFCTINRKILHHPLHPRGMGWVIFDHFSTVELTATFCVQMYVSVWWSLRFVFFFND